MPFSPSNIAPADLALAREFVHSLAQRHDSSRFQVTLYGSRARGDADEESDLDLFVALEDDDPNGALRDAAQDIATALTINHGVLVSVFVADASFRRRHAGYSFLETVAEEGIPL